MITHLRDLRPGDIMLGPVGGLVPGLFPVGLGQLILGELFRVGNMSIRHAGIVVEASRQLPPGAGWPLRLWRDALRATVSNPVAPGGTMFS